MKDAATLLALAATVESLTGADREVDAAIATALGWHDVRWNRPHGGYWSHEVGDDLQVMRPVPEWSVSLDAAMSLLPKGWTLTLSELWRTTSWTADLTRRPSKGQAIAFNEGRTIGLDSVRVVSATTAALAITAAALRAHAAIAGEG